ncbi:MAG TPA: hypothetical protein VNU97_01615 [Rhizomicrobium sp.]|nr:hypothetical protein [Rhizomicrobium sp.]
MAVLATIGLLLVAFGVGFLSYALAAALTPTLGVAGGAAVTGAVFVGPPVLWASVTLMLASKPKPKPLVAPNGLWTVLFAAIAKETPWIAIAGAGLVAAAEIFLASRKRS